MTSRHRRLSAALAALLAGLLAGCASRPAGPIWPPLDDPALQAYAQQLACRLVTRCDDYPVQVIDLPEPQAEALPDGRIVIRLGLLLAVQEEAELAFVLAHEIAHRQRGHRAPRTLAARLPLELEADAVALATLRRLGYPEDAGSRLISRLKPAENLSDRHRIARQQIEVRLAALPTPADREAWLPEVLDRMLRAYRVDPVVPDTGAPRE
jgi:predicted Zn-dependent protease